ncbi:MAG: hypothetical protein RIS35_165 [Pseudomonadota bacterium]
MQSSGVYKPLPIRRDADLSASTSATGTSAHLRPDREPPSGRAADDSPGRPLQTTPQSDGPAPLEASSLANCESVGAPADLSESIPRVTDRITSDNEIRIKLGYRGLTEALASAVEPAIPTLTLFAATILVTGRLRPADLILGFLVFFVFSWSLQGFQGPARIGLAAIASSWTGAVLILAGIGYSTDHLPHFDPRVMISWLVVGPLAHTVATRYRKQLLGSVVKLRRPHRAIVVGANELGIAFAKSLAADRLAHTQLVAYFDDRQTPRAGEAPALIRAGTFKDVARYVKDNGIDYVYLALPMASQPRVTELLASLRDTTTSVYFVPNVYTLDLIQTRIESRAGFPVVSAYDSPFRGLDGLTKRVTDLAIASFALVAVSPLLLAIAIGVRLSGPGPIIFKQRRFGLDGKDIVVYKFRSMSVTENGASRYVQATREDSRITPFGRFIRKTSLDELPQLINVIQGRMSLVGPRPHVTAVNEHYRALIDGYMLRHKVRPGITGWAQIHGYRGGDDLASMRMRIAYDIDYIRRWSVWLDLFILWRTAFVVFRDPNAY